jgi:hypothetical protein
LCCLLYFVYHFFYNLLSFTFSLLKSSLTSFSCFWVFSNFLSMSFDNHCFCILFKLIQHLKIFSLLFSLFLFIYLFNLFLYAYIV